VGEECGWGFQEGRLVRVGTAYDDAMIHGIQVHNFNNTMGILISKYCRIHVACYMQESNARLRECFFMILSGCIQLIQKHGGDEDLHEISPNHHSVSDYRFQLSASRS
jgi:hypothetical protein